MGESHVTGPQGQDHLDLSEGLRSCDDDPVVVDVLYSGRHCGPRMALDVAPNEGVKLGVFLRLDRELCSQGDHVMTPVSSPIVEGNVQCNEDKI